MFQHSSSVQGCLKYIRVQVQGLAILPQTAHHGWRACGFKLPICQYVGLAGGSLQLPCLQVFIHLFTSILTEKSASKLRFKEK